METIRGDVSLIGDVLRAKPRPQPDTGWAYEVATLATAQRALEGAQLQNSVCGLLHEKRARIYSLSVNKLQ
jgi:hypothetical protein